MDLQFAQFIDSFGMDIGAFGIKYPETRWFRYFLQNLKADKWALLILG
jgi:hypothetical protein